LFRTRLLLVVLVIAGLGLQAELWISDEGYRKTIDLRAAVAEQRALNETLRNRNGALDAEVINLKQGRDAAEERARTDLGMIGKKETFYQVVPVAASSYRE
jgi:cell division protein FtsB